MSKISVATCAAVGPTWSASYSPVGGTETALALGETSADAYRGDRGKTAYDHSQATTGTPHGTAYAVPNQTCYIGTTAVAINRSSASLSLTGVSIDGAAGSVPPSGIAYTQTGGSASVTLQAYLDQSGVRPEAFRAVGNGTADDTTALADANTYAAANSKPLYLTGKYSVTNDVTLTAPVIALPGAYITVATTKTVTYGGGITVDPTTYFYRGAGTHAPQKVLRVYPTQWGAVADCASGNSYHGTNSTAAIQAASDASFAANAILTFLPGGYYIDAPITLPDATSHPTATIRWEGCNTNTNSSGLRGNCWIECDAANMFEPKTAFVASVHRVKMICSDLCFYGHYSDPILYKNINFSTSQFSRNLVVHFGQCWSFIGGVTEIRDNHFINQQDSVIKMQSGQYAADAWIINNYINGDPAKSDLVLLQLYSLASYHIKDNYIDYAKTGIWVYYCTGSTAGKNEISGNTFDILYEGIRTDRSSQLSITNNVFRRCNLASRASYLPNCPNEAWQAINILTGTYDTAIVGNNYSDCDAFIKVRGPGVWNLREIGNVGTGCDVVNRADQTLDTSTYAKDNTKNYYGSQQLASVPNPSVMPSIRAEFLGGSVQDGPFVPVAVASGTYAPGTSASSHEGVIRITAHASNANSGAAITTGASIVFSGGEIIGFVFKCPTTGNLQARLGWADNLDTPGSAPTEGSWIDIAGTTVSGKSAKESSITTTGTTYTLTADTWYYAEVRKNMSNTNGQFQIYLMDGTVEWYSYTTTNSNSTAPVKAGVAAIQTTADGSALLDIDCIDMCLNHLPTRAK